MIKRAKAKAGRATWCQRRGTPVPYSHLGMPLEDPGVARQLLDQRGMLGVARQTLGSHRALTKNSKLSTRALFKAKKAKEQEPKALAKRLELSQGALLQSQRQSKRKAQLLPRTECYSTAKETRQSFKAQLLPIALSSMPQEKIKERELLVHAKRLEPKAKGGG
ncbi:hypothetical protein AHAS_Ahas16G0195900 [Arachis hypogaea]